MLATNTVDLREEYLGSMDSQPIYLYTLRADFNAFSGRVFEVQSDMAGVQSYTANWWEGSLTGSQGVLYGKQRAIALETQWFPDSPNPPSFPYSILRPGDDFFSRTIYKFSLLDG